MDHGAVDVEAERVAALLGGRPLGGCLRALADDWAARVDDHDLVATDHALRTMLERANVQRIGYRPLRDLQRAG